MKEVDVRLGYETIEGVIATVDFLTTNESGEYSFTSLIPGEYIIVAEKLPDYQYGTIITINENITEKLNISIYFAPINVSGVTKEIETGDIISNITISFNSNESIKNNTAQPITIISDETGFFSINMMPGFYNITVNQIIEEDTNMSYRYSYKGDFEIKVGEETKTFDILITKEQI